MAFMPKPYMIYVTIKPTKRNMLKQTFTQRVRAADSIEDAKQAITDDKRSMNESWGNLIEAPGSEGRTYHIFKANWEAVA
jgi:hypothetical protein